MRVPVTKPPKGYKADTGFDQSPRQQELLNALVPVPNCYGFLVQIESLPGTAGENHVQRTSGNAVHAVHGALAVQVTAQRIEAVQKTMAIIEPLCGNAFRQPQIMPTRAGRHGWRVR